MWTRCIHTANHLVQAWKKKKWRKEGGEERKQHEYVKKLMLKQISWKTLFRKKWSIPKEKCFIFESSNERQWLNGKKRASVATLSRVNCSALYWWLACLWHVKELREFCVIRLFEFVELYFWWKMKLRACSQYYTETVLWRANDDTRECKNDYFIFSSKSHKSFVTTRDASSEFGLRWFLCSIVFPSHFCRTYYVRKRWFRFHVIYFAISLIRIVAAQERLHNDDENDRCEIYVQFVIVDYTMLAYWQWVSRLYHCQE